MERDDETDAAVREADYLAGSYVLIDDGEARVGTCEDCGQWVCSCVDPMPEWIKARFRWGER